MSIDKEVRKGLSRGGDIITETWRTRHSSLGKRIPGRQRAN
jgi:hypothetical protein